jgi:hypothetical protein
MNYQVEIFLFRQPLVGVAIAWDRAQTQPRNGHPTLYPRTAGHQDANPAGTLVKPMTGCRNMVDPIIQNLSTFVFGRRRPAN